MPSCCAKRSRSVIGMPATPKIVSTPFSLSASTTRWKPSVISPGIPAALISPTLLLVAQGLMTLGALRQPLTRLYAGGRQQPGVAHKWTLAESTANLQPGFSHRLYSPSGAPRSQAGRQVIAYHENAANLATPARSRRGRSMDFFRSAPHVAEAHEYRVRSFFPLRETSGIVMLVPVRGESG